MNIFAFSNIVEPGAHIKMIRINGYRLNLVHISRSLLFKHKEGAIRQINGSNHIKYLMEMMEFTGLTSPTKMEKKW